MKKLRLATLGLGSRGRGLTHMYAQHPDISIVGLCDLYEKNLAAAVGESCLNDPSIPVFTDFNDMLDNCPMDALFITVAPNTQVKFACEAMERGIHVMTEVPCTYTIEDCWKLIDTVEKTGMHYMMAEQLRYGYCFKQWREMYEAGKFGKMLFVEGQYTHYEKWGFYQHKKTGDVVADLTNFEPAYFIKKDDAYIERAKHYKPEDFEMTWRFNTFNHPIYYMPHELSPILSVFNDRVTEVVCFGSEAGVSSVSDGHPANPENRDVEAALMRTEKDAIIRVMACFNTYCHPGHWYHFQGSLSAVESSRISYDTFDVSAPMSWDMENKWQQRPEWTFSHSDADELAKNSGHGGVDWYPIQNFANLLLKGGPNTMDVYRAVETAAPAILAAKSAEHGGAKMEVPDFRAKYGRDIKTAYKLV